MRKCPQCESEYEDAVAFCGHDGTITIQVQTDPSDLDPRLGTSLGSYVLVARVADGAMGRVYEGRHPETKQRVAVKVLHADVARDEVAVERFKREYETAEEFDHPHIVNVLEFGETGDGSCYLTMEYLQGAELSDRVQESGALAPHRALRIFCQLAAALDHAHSFGVIHRDLKPENIFLCESEAGDIVKVLDFGSVKLQMETGPKLTAFGTTLGSPYYMSPEQAMGKLDVDQRTDVFAIAAIFWEMATGKVAFEGGNVAEILMKIVNHDPPGISTRTDGFPPVLDAVIQRGLRKDKAERQGSAGELANDIVRAFGLDGDHQRWASAPLQELADVMSVAAPPPAVTVPDPLPGKALQQEVQSSAVAAPAASKRTLVVGLVVGAVIAIAAGLAMFLVVG